MANEKKLEEKRLKAEERDKLKKEEDKLNVSNFSPINFQVDLIVWLSFS